MQERILVFFVLFKLFEFGNEKYKIISVLYTKYKSIEKNSLITFIVRNVKKIKFSLLYLKTLIIINFYCTL